MTAAEQRKAEIARDFFAAWGESFDALCRAFETTLAEDGVWDQRPIPRIRGPRAAIRFLRLARTTMGMQTIDVEVTRVAVSGDVVHVERVDHLLRADGSRIASAPVAGVLTFDGDRVVHWREYFDGASFAAQALASTVRRGATLPLRLLAARRSA